MCAVYGNERMSCLSPVQLQDMAREGWRAGAHPEELLGREDGCRGGGEGGRMGAVILNIGPLDTAPARSGDTRGEGWC